MAEQRDEPAKLPPKPGKQGGPRPDPKPNIERATNHRELRGGS